MTRNFIVFLYACLCAVPAAAAPARNAVVAQPSYSCTVDWHVDAVAGSDNNPGTAAKPFKTIARATWQNTALIAGDCVDVAPGIYAETVWLSRGGNANAPTGYVVLKSTVKWGAQIIGPSPYSVVNLQSNYLIVDGFDISAESPASGSTCVDGTNTQYRAHHLLILNNRIHDCGGGGVEFCYSEWWSVEGNTVFRTASTNGYQMSGISLCGAVSQTGKYAPSAADLAATYHNIVAGNTSYANIEGPKIPAPHTDGEGIIIDWFHNSDPFNAAVNYPFKTLVAGNIAYGNGGNGIQVGRSDYVTVSNNTVWGNNLDPLNNGMMRGGLENNNGSNNSWINNIAVGVPGAGTLASNNAIESGGGENGYVDQNVTWQNNIAFVTAPSTNGPAQGWYPDVVGVSSNQIGVNPMLADPAAGDFAPAASPAIGAAQSIPLVPGFPAMPNIGAE